MAPRQHARGLENDLSGMKRPEFCVPGLRRLTLLLLGSVSVVTGSPDGAIAASPAETPGDLAQQLSNPVAALISVPFQGNIDFGGGPEGEGVRYQLNLQPVVPFSVSPEWNLISRTILPFIRQDDWLGNGGQSGIGDTVQSFFLSPPDPSAGGWIWGVGPVFLLPTASDGQLGSEKWAAGPTAVVLRQVHGWTYGLLANHLVSFAGEGSRSDLNATFLQPFVTFTRASQTTFALNSESTYDWESDQWTAPVNLSVAQLAVVDGTPVQFQAGVRYYVDAPSNGPEWGLRLAVTLLFPR